MKNGSVDRKIETYDVRADLARWSGWRFLPVPLEGIMREVVSERRRVVLMDQQWFEQDPDLALAHVLAHLDLGHHEFGGQISNEQEGHATWLAQVRLDRKEQP